MKTFVIRIDFEGGGHILREFAALTATRALAVALVAESGDRDADHEIVGVVVVKTLKY